MKRLDLAWTFGVVAVAFSGWLAGVARAEQPQQAAGPGAQQSSPLERWEAPNASGKPQKKAPNHPLNSPPSQSPASARRGASPKIAPPVRFTTEDGKKGWKVVIPGGRPLATPAVVDGKLFIGGGFGSYEFYAFDAQSGNLVWRHHTTDDGPTAAVVRDGYVAFNTESCELEVLTIGGKPVWKKWLGDPLMSMPAIDAGRLLMAFPNSRGDHQHYLACFELTTGKKLWQQKIPGEVITAPLVSGRKVLVATLDGTLYCLRANDGTPAWSENGTNATSTPTVWNGRCWFSRRQETTVTRAGKKVRQETEQVAVRGLEAGVAVRDLVNTARQADYLDYAKRARAPAATGGGSAKEAASQATDKIVGFGGATAPATSSLSGINAAAPSGGKGDAKIQQAQTNLGKGSVHGVWSYQGSKPLFYEGRLYAAMGDSVLCVDPESEEVLWKRAFGPPGRGKDEKHQQVELLDAIVTPPALVNHKVFVGTAHGAIVCLSAAKGKMLWTATVQGSIAFQPAVAEGRVYVSTESGTLYCLETGDAQDDGWLMWGANAAHTGRAGP